GAAPSRVPGSGSWRTCRSRTYRRCSSTSPASFRSSGSRARGRSEPLASASGRGPGHGAAPRGRLRRLVRPRTSRRGPARLPRGHRGRLLRDRLPDERLLAPPAVGLLRPGAARGRTPPARAPPAARRGGTRPRGATLHRPALPGTLARPPAPLCRHARQLRDHAAARLGLAPLRGRRRPLLPRDPGRRTGRPLRPRRGRRLARVSRALPGGGRRRTRSDVLPPGPPAGTARTRAGSSPGGLHRLRRAAGARRPARCRRAAPGCARLPLRPPSAPVPGLPAPPGGDRTGRAPRRAVPAAARGVGGPPGGGVGMARLPAPAEALADAFGPHLSYEPPGGFAARAAPDRKVNTHCCFCGQQCGVTLLVKDERVVGIEPWEEFPFNQGKLCPKGIKRYL